MSDGKLVFIRPADGTGRLVFNDDSVATVPDVNIGLDATFAGESAEMPASVQLLWDAGVSRGEAIETRIHWQDAQPTRALASAHWQDAERATSRALRDLCARRLRTVSGFSYPSRFLFSSRII